MPEIHTYLFEQRKQNLHVPSCRSNSPPYLFAGHSPRYSLQIKFKNEIISSMQFQNES